MISESNRSNAIVVVQSLSHVRFFATLWTVACQALLSMEISRQEYWSGLPFPSPGLSSQPRDQTQVSHIAGRFFNVWATREAHMMHQLGSKVFTQMRWKWLSTQNPEQKCLLPGASVRNAACGKGHEGGGSAYAKAGSSLRRPPVPKHLPPKTRVCLLYCVMLSTYSSDINRELSPNHLFLEKVNLELLDNKSPGHNTSVSIQNPLWWLSSLPARLLQLRMWLFTAFQLQEAQKA